MYAFELDILTDLPVPFAVKSHESILKIIPLEKSSTFPEPFDGVVPVVLLKYARVAFVP
jgi:hypothetical protein